MNRSISILVVPALFVVGCSKTESSAPPATMTATSTSPSSVVATPSANPPPSSPPPVAAECSFKNGSACQVKCDGGDQKACLWLGLATAGTADRDVAQRERGITILEKACSAKLVRACVHVALQKNALILKKHKRAPNSEEKTEKFTAMTKACEANDGVACNLAAKNLKEGYGVAQDEAKSKTLREKGIKLMTKECDGEDPESCLALGILYMGGSSGAPGDTEKAKKYLALACKLGEEAGCKGVPEGWPSGK